MATSKTSTTSRTSLWDSLLSTRWKRSRRQSGSISLAVSAVEPQSLPRMGNVSITSRDGVKRTYLIPRAAIMRYHLMSLRSVVVSVMRPSQITQMKQKMAMIPRRGTSLFTGATASACVTQKDRLTGFIEPSRAYQAPTGSVLASQNIKPSTQRYGMDSEPVSLTVHTLTTSNEPTVTSRPCGIGTWKVSGLKPKDLSIQAGNEPSTPSTTAPSDTTTEKGCCAQ